MLAIVKTEVASIRSIFGEWPVDTAMQWWNWLRLDQIESEIVQQILNGSRGNDPLRALADQMNRFFAGWVANAFGFAMFMTLLFREKVFGWTIFFWAVVTAYSRIYLGVHFITDIIPGALSGVFFGYIVYLLYAKVRKCWLKGKTEPFIEKPSERYSDRRKHAIVCTIFLTISVIVLANNWLVRL